MGKLARFLNRQPYNSTIQDRQVLCRAECVAALKEEKRLAAATIIPIGFMYGCIFIQIYHETSIIVGKCTTHGSYVTITIAIVSAIVLMPLIPLLLHMTKLLVLLIVLVPSSDAIITISSLVIHSILISNTKGTGHVWSAQLQLHCNVPIIFSGQHIFFSHLNWLFQGRFSLRLGHIIQVSGRIP